MEELTALSRLKGLQITVLLSLLTSRVPSLFSLNQDYRGQEMRPEREGGGQEIEGRGLALHPHGPCFQSSGIGGD